MLYVIQIDTIGEVAFDRDITSNRGYRYDVPLDLLNIPHIPISTLFEEAGLDDIDIKKGFAYPIGYPSIIQNALLLTKKIKDCEAEIRNVFINERFIEDKLYSICAIKPGLSFIAGLRFDMKYYKKVKEALSSITHIGVRDEGISGEVEVKMRSYQSGHQTEDLLSPKCRYDSLEVSYIIQSPLCLYAPYNEDEKTEKYIPGNLIYADIVKNAAAQYDIDVDNVKCSNAYLSYKGERMVPLPICSSVVKLDKEEMRYRLSHGRDYTRVEQDINIKDAYAIDYNKHMTYYAKPQTERIESRDGTVYDVLIPGQVMKSVIYADDKDIRKIYEYIKSRSLLNLGVLCNEGYGEVYHKVDKARIKEAKEEIFSRYFDVLCVSDVLLLNDEAVSTVSTDAFVHELEYVLNLSGVLRAEAMYTKVHTDYSDNVFWNKEGCVNRCIKKGSVYRIIVSGDPIDIEPIIHCFIGERTSEGYGEIISYPAKNEYYRKAEEIEMPLYDYNYSVDIGSVEMGASFTHSVIKSSVKKMISAFATFDKKEGIGLDIDESTVNVLRAIKDTYIPDESIDTLIDWYMEEMDSDS